jgi:enoyl-CoA hydratase
MSDILHYTIYDEVALVRLDNGKANSLSPDLITGLEQALDRAASDARAVVVAGREGLFCAGFELSIMRASAESARALVRQGAELFTRLYLHPQPVVAACTGHAIAAGAVLLMTADLRIGARGRFKVGLNEVAIGLRLPAVVVELAGERLCRRHLARATTLAHIYTPDEACEVGFLDRVVEPDHVIQTALAEARRLAALPADSLARTKAIMRTPLAERVRAGLDADLQDRDFSPLIT